MSLSQNPLTGSMRHSMGNFVTTVYRGQNVIKAKVFMPRNVNSSAQQLQRACFKLVVDAYESLGGIAENGFPGRPRTYSPFNAFVKANLSSAVDKSGITPVIDYTKLVIASGTLPAIVTSTGITGATGIIIGYETNTDIPKVLPSDQVVAIAQTKIGELLVSRQARGSNALSTILIAYPNITATEVKCCYVFVLSEDGSKASKSVSVQVS